MNYEFCPPIGEKKTINPVRYLLSLLNEFISDIITKQFDKKPFKYEICVIYIFFHTLRQDRVFPETLKWILYSYIGFETKDQEIVTKVLLF